jgi:hypothetical protein
MSSLKIELDLDNATFDDDDLPGEVARILHNLADRISEQSRAYLAGNGSRMVARDLNGNKVGTAKFEIEAGQEVLNFVRDMPDEDLRRALEELCGCQCYDHETRETWVDALVDNINDGTTSIEDIESHFGY